MPNIDIPVSVDLAAMFELPACEDISLPKPTKLKIALPTGGSLSAITDVSKGIPNDCSLTFSLLLQIAPLLGSIECLIRVLKLLKPLIELLKALPLPSPKLIADFVKAAEGVAECLLVPTPLRMIPFVRDILCLVLKVLKCLIGQLKTILGVMQGLTIKINAATEAGNSELLAALQCSMDNAQTAAGHLTNSVEPIGLILELVEPFMEIAGISPIKLPKMGSQNDLNALNSALQALQSVVATLQVVVDALGGCDS
jgi:hypothetical protein